MLCTALTAHCAMGKRTNTLSNVSVCRRKMYSSGSQPPAINTGKKLVKAKRCCLWAGQQYPMLRFLKSTAMSKSLNPRPHMLFFHPRTHMGGHPMPFRTVITVVELWDKDQTIPWDGRSPRVDLFRLYLDPSRWGRSKKDSDLTIYHLLQITFTLTKIAE